MHAKDLLLGPAKYFKNGRDYIKRSAGPIASGIKMGGRIEPIMIKDSVFYLNKEDESDIIFEEQYNKLSAKKRNNMMKLIEQMLHHLFYLKMEKILKVYLVE